MAKLIRNRSTKELRAWWDAVLKAAAFAPKLSVEKRKAK